MKKIFVLILFCICFIVSESYAMTSFLIMGDDRDYITGGGTYSFDDSQGFFSIRPKDFNRDTLIDTLLIDFHGNESVDSQSWNFTFSLRNTDQNLTTGLYVAEYDGSPQSGPRLDVSGRHRGNNISVGTFEILNMQFDYSDVVPGQRDAGLESFGVRFEQFPFYGNGPSDYGLSGHLYHNYTPSAAVPEPSSMMLLGTGLLGGAFLRKKRKA